MTFQNALIFMIIESDVAIFASYYVTAISAKHLPRISATIKEYYSLITLF